MFFPAAVDAAPLPPQLGPTFTATPSGGGAGTRIRVSGDCNTFGPGGFATLARRTETDASQGTGDVSFFRSSNGRFDTELTNPWGSENGFPVDAQVAVDCGGPLSAPQPFQATSAPETNSPTIFTTLGAGACNSGAPGTCPTLVKGFGSDGSFSSTNFEVGWTGGSSIAVGDVNDDGRPDIAVGAPPGTLPTFFVYSEDGTLITGGSAYGDFRGGVSVAVGDVTGDGRDDLVTGARAGGGPHVKVFSFNRQSQAMEEVGGFFAYDAGFTGGVNVAVGELASNANRADIVTAPGPGGGPHVRVFHGDGTPVGGGFFAYAPAFHGGVSVAVADMNDDGSGEIVTGAGPGGGPHVRVLRSDGVALSEFYAYAPTFTGGVWVAAGHAGSWFDDAKIVTAPGAPGHAHIRVFDATGSSTSGGFYAYQPFSGPGAYVAVAP